MVQEPISYRWNRFVRECKTRWRLVTVIGVLIGIAIALHTDLFTFLSIFGPENASEQLRQADGIIQYGVIFVLAAIPLVEILVVIPIGIGVGMDPVSVAFFAFLGNVFPICGIIIFHERLKSWWLGRSTKSGKSSNRKARARSIWNRYGLPGLALVSPIATGVHIAAVIALVLGSRKWSVTVWMTGAIMLWTILLTVSVYYGIALVVRL